MWTLRCVSYEMYQLFAATLILYPENVSKICSSDKESIKALFNKRKVGYNDSKAARRRQRFSGMRAENSAAERKRDRKENI